MAKKPASQSVKAIHHTGIVWAATFIGLSEEFLDECNWEVNLTPQKRLPFEAYAIWQSKSSTGKHNITIRYFDRSDPPVNEDTAVTVTLKHPNAK